MLVAIQRADEQELEPRHFVARNPDRPLSVLRASEMYGVEAIGSRRLAITGAGMLEQTLQADVSTLSKTYGRRGMRPAATASRSRRPPR